MKKFRQTSKFGLVSKQDLVSLANELSSLVGINPESVLKKCPPASPKELEPSTAQRYQACEDQNKIINSQYVGTATLELLPSKDPAEYFLSPLLIQNHAAREHLENRFAGADQLMELYADAYQDSNLFERLCEEGDSTEPEEAFQGSVLRNVFEEEYTQRYPRFINERLAYLAAVENPFGLSDRAHQLVASDAFRKLMLSFLRPLRAQIRRLYGRCPVQKADRLFCGVGATSDARKYNGRKATTPWGKFGKEGTRYIQNPYHGLAALVLLRGDLQRAVFRDICERAYLSRNGKTVDDEDRKLQLKMGSDYLFPDYIHQVPKSSTTNRNISVPTTLTSALRAVLNKKIDRSLSRAGQDLPSVCRTQRLRAYVGSKTGLYDTIDFSDASDTISLALFEICFGGFKEYSLHLATRSVSYLNPYTGQGGWLQKYSAMGDKATFSIESIIFQSIADAAQSITSAGNGVATRANDVLKEEAKRLGIKLCRAVDEGASSLAFGDDLTVPANLPIHFWEALYATFGLRVNFTKSFGWESGRREDNDEMSWFREACGADYYGGTFVRGFYLKTNNPTLFDLFRCINFFRIQYNVPYLIMQQLKTFRRVVRKYAIWRYSQTVPTEVFGRVKFLNRIPCEFIACEDYEFDTYVRGTDDKALIESHFDTYFLVQVALMKDGDPEWETDYYHVIEATRPYDDANACLTKVRRDRELLMAPRNERCFLTKIRRSKASRGLMFIPDLVACLADPQGDPEQDRLKHLMEHLPGFLRASAAK